MSVREIKTFEWKCDDCGQRIRTQGFDAEDSRPEEMGVMIKRIPPTYTRNLDICNHCWNNETLNERHKPPAILAGLLTTLLVNAR
jgi:hypothetical protein